jgi:hypothetical protein
MPRKATALVALLTAVAVAAPAQAAKINIKPRSPIVDEDISASFRPKLKLKSGWHYSALLTVRSDSVGCVDIATKDSRSKKRVVSIRLSSYTDGLVDSGAEWCQGSATLSVIKERDDDENGDTGVLVGITSFRFRAQP